MAPSGELSLCKVETMLHEYWWFTNWKILMFHRSIDFLGYWKVYDGHQIGMHWAYQYCGKQTMASWYCVGNMPKKHQNDSEIVLSIPRGRLIFHWIYYSRFSDENHYKWFIWEYLRLRLQRISISFIRYPIWIFAPNMVCVNHSCGGWWRTYNGNVNRGVPSCKIPNQLYFCYINVPIFFWLKASLYCILMMFVVFRGSYVTAMVTRSYLGLPKNGVLMVLVPSRTPKKWQPVVW